MRIDLHPSLLVRARGNVSFMCNKRPRKLSFLNKVLILGFLLRELRPVILSCSLNSWFLTLYVWFVEKCLSTLDSTNHAIFYAFVGVFIHFNLCIVTFCSLLVLALNLFLLAVGERSVAPRFSLSNLVNVVKLDQSRLICIPYLVVGCICLWLIDKRFFRHHLLLRTIPNIQDVTLYLVLIPRQ